MLFSIRKILLFFFYSFGFLSLFLPSGSVFGINFKFVSFILMLGAVVLVRDVAARFFLYAFAIAAVLFLWILTAAVGYAQDMGMAALQFKDIFISAIYACLLKVILEKGYISNEEFCNHVVKWLLAIAIMKALIITASFVSGMPVYLIMDSISKLFGVVLMSYDLGDIGGRIQFVSDFALPAALFYVVAIKRSRSRFDFACIFILMFSTFISFSRYLWGYAGIMLFLAYFLRARSKTGFFSLLIFALIFCGIYFAYEDQVGYILWQRFFSSGAVESDAVREVQFVYLLSWFKDAPVFGHGLGSYIPGYTRSDDLPYSYELQLLALLGQVGILGVMMYFVGILYFYGGLARAALKKSFVYPFVMLALLSFWVLSGVYNPLLFSSAAAVIYALIYAIFREMAFRKML